MVASDATVPKRKRASTVEFGGRVRAKRMALDVSQMELAEAAGIHWTYLSSVERGERNIGLENILRIAVALDVDPGDLVRGLRPS